MHNNDAEDKFLPRGREPLPILCYNLPILLTVWPLVYQPVSLSALSLSTCHTLPFPTGLIGDPLIGSPDNRYLLRNSHANP
ncbi:MAG: hypothetical protein KA314_15790 [Chloroflexi bacterium]|nr:hypothetical protein [Chloroflexota bacterium]MBP8057297.1 hypothetical protein [Chloroflexota bacterium]